MRVSRYASYASYALFFRVKCTPRPAAPRSPSSPALITDESDTPVATYTGTVWIACRKVERAAVSGSECARMCEVADRRGASRRAVGIDLAP